jgi:hypothetical protein
MLMKNLLFSLSFFAISIVILGQEELNTGIIYGKNYVFSLKAPDGWILDNKSGARQGLQAVFYRKGESWNNALTVIYANCASLEDPAHKTLNELINYDTNNFKKQYPGISILDGDSITIKIGLNAKVKLMSGQSYNNFDAIAYVDAGKNGIMIVMSSRTKEGFDSSKKAFESVVKSYVYIADKMTIK